MKWNAWVILALVLALPAAPLAAPAADITFYVA